MTNRKRGLGRGLDALLGEVGELKDAPRPGEVSEIPLERIRRSPYQARRHFDDETLTELTDSIRAQGVIQPVVVRQVEDDAFELIAGERRWRAAQLAELASIPAVVRDVTDQVAVALGLIENIQRENLNPLEEAEALRRLQTEFDMTHQAVAEAVGRSRTAVTNLLRLLELSQPVRERIDAGELEMGHARALLGLEGPLQAKVASEVASKGLSVRETERLVQRLSRQSAAQEDTAASRDPDVDRLERQLAETLGARVALQHGRRGKGRVVIHYNNLDELEGILSHIQ